MQVAYNVGVEAVPQHPCAIKVALYMVTGGIHMQNN